MKAGVATLVAATVSVIVGAAAHAAPQFVNGLVFPGNSVDKTRGAGANQNRLGFFSDLYYDPQREEWWAVSDRGPGGGLIDYSTRVQLLDIDLDSKTGAIRNVRVKKTVKFTDPRGPARGARQSGHRRAGSTQRPEPARPERRRRGAWPQLRSGRLRHRPAQRELHRVG